LKNESNIVDIHRKKEVQGSASAAKACVCDKGSSGKA